MNESVDDDEDVRDEWEQETTSPEVPHGGESELKKIRVQPRVSMFEKAEPEPELVADERNVDDVTRLVRSVDPGKERIKVAKVKFEKLEERLDEAERQELQWGGAANIGWRSILIGGSIVIILIVALVVMRGFFRGDDSTEIGISPLVEIEADQDPYKDSPEKWLRDRSGVIEVEALRVMQDKRVTLSIRKAKKEALPSQVELVELLNLEWVTP